MILCMFKAFCRSTTGRFKMNLIVDTDCALDDIFALSLLDSAPDICIPYIVTVNGLNNVNDGAKTTDTLFGSSLFINKPSVIRGVVSLPNEAILSEIDWYQDYQRSLQAIEKDIQSRFPGSGGDGTSSTDDVDNASISPAANQSLTSALSQLSSVENAGRENVLLCLGPLTNIAALLKTQPDALSCSISRLVIMGGAVHATGSRAHGAEFNFHLDPLAAHDVIHHCGVPVELISLDVANMAAFTPQDLPAQTVDSVFRGPDQSACRGFESKAEFLRYLQKTFPDSACYDPVAAYYLVNSKPFAMEDVRVYVDPITGVVHICDTGTHSDGVTLTEAMQQSGIMIKSAVSFDRASYVKHIKELLAL